MRHKFEVVKNGKTVIRTHDPRKAIKRAREIWDNSNIVFYVDGWVDGYGTTTAQLCDELKYDVHMYGAKEVNKNIDFYVDLCEWAFN